MQSQREELILNYMSRINNGDSFFNIHNLKDRKEIVAMVSDQISDGSATKKATDAYVAYAVKMINNGKMTIDDVNPVVKDTVSKTL